MTLKNKKAQNEKVALPFLEYAIIVPYIPKL